MHGRIFRDPLVDPQLWRRAPTPPLLFAVLHHKFADDFAVLSKIVRRKALLSNSRNMDRIASGSPDVVRGLKVSIRWLTSVVVDWAIRDHADRIRHTFARPFLEIPACLRDHGYAQRLAGQECRGQPGREDSQRAEEGILDKHLLGVRRGDEALYDGRPTRADDAQAARLVRRGGAGALEARRRRVANMDGSPRSIDARRPHFEGAQSLHRSDNLHSGCAAGSRTWRSAHEIDRNLVSKKNLAPNRLGKIPERFGAEVLTADDY